jgi:hypothetical protein
MKWKAVSQDLGLQAPFWHVHDEAGNPVALNVTKKNAKQIAAEHNFCLELMDMVLHLGAKTHEV